MPGLFESASKVAIEEIIRARSSASKFGVVLSAEALRDVVDDLYNLLQTSRSLKAAGDRMLQGTANPTPAPRGRQERTR